MITESQQKTISELQEFFTMINSLEAPPSNMMEEIEAELNRARALKLKSEAALKVVRSKAHEIMANHVESVWKPILDRFLPSVPSKVYEDGGFYLNVSYHTFSIKSLIHERRNEDKSKYYEYAGFQLQGHNQFDTTTSLSDFDEAFKNFVIDSAKSNESLYY